MPYSAKYELKSDVARFFLGKLRGCEEISAIVDQKITPTLVDDIVNALVILIQKKPVGICHICTTTPITPFEFVKLIGEIFGLETTKLNSVKLSEYNRNKLAKLLRNSTLNPAKFERQFGKGILQSVEENLRLFKTQQSE